MAVLARGRRLLQRRDERLDLIALDYVEPARSLQFVALGLIPIPGLIHQYGPRPYVSC